MACTQILKRKYIVLFFTIFTAVETTAFDFSGYLKTSPSQLYYPQFSSRETNWLNEVYFDFSQQLNSVHLELATQLQHFSSSTVLEKTYHYRIINIPKPLSKELSGSTYQELFFNIDRLNLEYFAENFRVDIGRQALSLGISKIISPLDIINPFNIINYDIEKKDGVDGIRTEFQISNNSSVIIGGLSGARPQEEGLQFLQIKKQYNNISVTGSIIEYQDTPIVGLGLITSILGAGFYIEGTETINNIQKKNSEHMSVGIDYRFENSFYFNIEYYYNGSGSLTENSVSQLWFYPLKNQQYILLNYSYEITPLLIIKLNNYINIFDGSQMASAKLEYNFSENFYALIGGGRSYSYSPSGEFSSFPDFAYVSVKYFF